MDSIAILCVIMLSNMIVPGFMGNYAGPSLPRAGYKVIYTEDTRKEFLSQMI